MSSRTVAAAAFVIGGMGLVQCGLDGQSFTSDCKTSNTCPDGSTADVTAPDAGGPEVIVVVESGSGDDKNEDGSDALVCGPGLKQCGDTCVDPTQPAHCGRCDNVCDGPDAGAGQATCSNGVCGLGCDVDGSTPLNCGGACVDPTQPAHCGGCAPCAAPPSGNGQATCTGAADGGRGCGVACATGFHECQGDCKSDGNDPSVDPCVVADTTGVFVAPSGSDTAAGTMAAPMQTIGAAIAKALPGHKRVYACVGTYDEQLLLDAAADGLKVFGALDCKNGWKYVGSAAGDAGAGAGSATIVATPAGKPAPGTALTVTGAMTNGVTFEDVGFVAIDGVSPGDSSVAVFASAAKLTLARGDVTAGKALKGGDGASARNWPGTAVPAKSPADSTTGGLGGTNSCSDSTTSTGGQGGGEVTFPPPVFGAGQPGSPVSAMNGGSAGAGSCMAGGTGSPASAPSSAGSAAPSSGSIGSSGWARGGPGGDGNNGLPGQGGGGGGGDSVNGPGGGGGYGGCGGEKGTGGSTGGSSLAIVSYQSILVLTSVTIATSSAGDGGKAGSGQDGQAGVGGAQGGRPANASACAGGSGGQGSGGSGGGGGAGGSSIGIAWLGSTGPNIDGTVVPQDKPTFAGITTGMAGKPGAAGGGGMGGGNAPSPSGSPGAAGTPNAIQQFH